MLTVLLASPNQAKIPVPGLSCETKPIRVGRGIRGASYWQACCAKRSQFGAGKERGYVLCGKGIMANQVRRRPRKTNPIAGWMGSDEAGQAADAARRSDRAKRTQFADRGTGLPAVRPELGSFVRRGCSRLCQVLGVTLTSVLLSSLIQKTRCPHISHSQVFSQK